MAAAITTMLREVRLVLILITLYCTMIIFQTMLVTGGNEGALLSSTELLVESASAWVNTGELPSPVYGPRGANIDNRVLMTGNR